MAQDVGSQGLKTGTFIQFTLFLITPNDDMARQRPQAKLIFTHIFATYERVR
jgi:hypothetical protein